MGWFSKILVQKINTGELVDITDLDQEHYESFLAAMEQLRIAYKVAIERKQKESTSEGNCIKPDVSQQSELLGNFANWFNSVYKSNIPIDQCDIDEFIKIAL